MCLCVYDVHMCMTFICCLINALCVVPHQGPLHVESIALDRIAGFLEPPVLLLPRCQGAHHVRLYAEAGLLDMFKALSGTRRPCLYRLVRILTIKSSKGCESHLAFIYRCRLQTTADFHRSILQALVPEKQSLEPLGQCCSRLQSRFA